MSLNFNLFNLRSNFPSATKDIEKREQDWITLYEIQLNEWFTKLEQSFIHYKKKVHENEIKNLAQDRGMGDPWL